MLDTVVLTLSKGMYTISHPEMFEPSAIWVLDEKLSMGSRGYVPSKQNPTRQELKMGIYKPRLTLTKRFNHAHRYEATLKIELSLPKLLYCNNFDELSDSDFESVVKILWQVLIDMGVFVYPAILKSAPVSSIHYSKNIPLTDGNTPYHFINKIRETNITSMLDVNRTDFRNEGHAIKFHANSYEVTFYDKIRDLQMSQRSTKRAVDTDSSIQLSLFESMKKRNFFEVLRMEVRLNKRQKIRQVFQQIGIKSDLTFEDIFKTKYSKAVLLHYLDYIENARPNLLDYRPSNPKKLLPHLAVQNSNLGARKLLQMYGLKTAIDKYGMRELRTILGSSVSSDTWYRLVREAKSIEVAPSNKPLSLLRSHIEEFVPLKLVDFQDKLLNNDKNGFDYEQ